MRALLLWLLLPTLLHAQDAQSILARMRQVWGIAALPPTEMIYTLTTQRYVPDGTVSEQVAKYRLFFGMRLVHYTQDGRTYELLPDSVRQLSGPPDGLTSTQRNAQYLQRLRSNLAYNFLYMLHRPDWQYSYVQAGTYAGHPVHILRAQWVGPAAWQMAPIDLFVSQQDATILTSSQPDASGHYPHYADESDYTRVAPNHLFPLSYRVLVNGQVQQTGQFSEVMVSVR